MDVKTNVLRPTTQGNVKDYGKGRIADGSIGKTFEANIRDRDIVHMSVKTDWDCQVGCPMDESGSGSTGNDLG